jgi:hypothetical protein
MPSHFIWRNQGSHNFSKLPRFLSHQCCVLAILSVGPALKPKQYCHGTSLCHRSQVSRSRHLLPLCGHSSITWYFSLFPKAPETRMTNCYCDFCPLATSFCHVSPVSPTCWWGEPENDLPTKAAGSGWMVLPRAHSGCHVICLLKCCQRMHVHWQIMSCLQAWPWVSDATVAKHLKCLLLTYKSEWILNANHLSLTQAAGTHVKGNRQSRGESQPWTGSWKLHKHLGRTGQHPSSCSQPPAQGIR